MKRIFPMLLAAASLLGVHATCLAQDPVIFTLTVSIPSTGKNLPRVHWVENGRPAKPSFQVTLRNVSGKPQQIYDHAFPIIEITDAAGRTWTPQRWTGGWIGGGRSGDEQTLQPGQTLVFDIYFTHGDEPRNGDIYFHFTPATHGGQPDYPSGKVIIWARCPLQQADLLPITDSATARPVTCVIDK